MNPGAGSLKRYTKSTSTEADSSRKKREGTQIHTIRNERGETTTDTPEIQRNVRKYYEDLYAKKCENLNEMDKLPEKYNLPKLNE